MGKSTTRPVAPFTPSDRQSVTVDKIKNGFLITRDGVRKGEYFSEREYSPTDPLAPAKRTSAKAK
jgi:hypothetical protein